MSNVPADAVVNPVSYFPNNMVPKIISALTAYIPLATYVERPCLQLDPSGCIGVYPTEWTADDDSYEIGQYGPTCSYYMLRVDNIVKALSEEAGRAQHSNIAKMIRVILYRDPDLRVALLGLSETILGVKEQVSKYRVIKQQYLASRINATFYYMAQTTIRVETSSTQQ